MTPAEHAGHSLAWQVQDKALRDLVDECVRLGLTREQTSTLWWIVATAFNRLYGTAS